MATKKKKRKTTRPKKPALSMAERFKPMTDQQGERAIKAAETALRKAGAMEFIICVRLTQNDTATQIEGRGDFVRGVARNLAITAHRGTGLDSLEELLKVLAALPTVPAKKPSPLGRLFGKKS